MEQEPHVSSQFFEFEQDGINVIHFRNNVKGFKGNSNVLFDETDGPNERILTDCASKVPPMQRILQKSAANTTAQC